ncbi:conserved hypothetical protein, membrane [Candidatus Omnitrophus magneticus]|uniref:Leucine rich repeat variant domain-containing protein n=1 Tax=Candidatus Omnitrophus magneticus TaxID=1609969 RepID=A0A0F0CPB4_9BACT|nr:conserved hypothetical protein, membrane [Candidatus Omnitrophus magneticus]
MSPVIPTQINPAVKIVEAQIPLESLAYDKNPEVRLFSAKNPNTPKETLAKLANDKNSDIREAVAMNPNTSKETLAMLAKDKHPFVRSAVAKNPNTPKETLAMLANLKTYQETLAKLAMDENHFVRISVAKNPNTPKETLAMLAKDKHPFVRSAVAKNPLIIARILELLYEDVLREEAVAMNPNASEGIFKKVVISFSILAIFIGIIFYKKFLKTKKDKKESPKSKSSESGFSRLGVMLTTAGITGAIFMLLNGIANVAEFTITDVNTHGNLIGGLSGLGFFLMAGYGSIDDDTRYPFWDAYLQLSRVNRSTGFCTIIPAIAVTVWRRNTKVVRSFIFPVGFPHARRGATKLNRPFRVQGNWEARHCGSPFPAEPRQTLTVLPLTFCPRRGQYVLATLLLHHP